MRMHDLDDEKTTFITKDANLCYKVMPFGLKNTSVSYQQLIDRVFKQQIRRNVEVYMEDMVVKSQSIPPTCGGSGRSLRGTMPIRNAPQP